MARTPEGEVAARLQTPARHVADNATFALAVAFACGVPLAEAADALQRFRPVAGRLRPLHTAHGAVVLDDAFNANPVSMAGALRVLQACPGRRWAVLGDMLELGPEEAEHHRAIVAMAQRMDLEQLIVVGPAFAGVLGPHASAVSVPTAEDALEVLHASLQPSDVVLVKGSRGVGLHVVVNALCDGM